MKGDWDQFFLKQTGRSSGDNSCVLPYLLHLADNSLILAHRNSEWCGHGPVLEQDIALANIALDLLGQARNFYQYAADLFNQKTEPGINAAPITEDSLAYLREAKDFKNCLLAEQPNGDWGKTILRQFLFSTFQYYLYMQLQKIKDERIAAIAEKALKEVTYHVRWSSEWVIRLGDGTEESHQRMSNALADLWPCVAELFKPATYESGCVKIGMAADLQIIEPLWHQKILETLKKATLLLPLAQPAPGYSGKEGLHTKHLFELLNEMQFLQRTYPGCEW